MINVIAEIFLKKTAAKLNYFFEKNVYIFNSITFKNKSDMATFRYFFIFYVYFLFSTTGAIAQTDSKETLKWVEVQADKIETTMNGVIRSQEPADLLLKLMDVYLIFETVTLAGIYCAEVREAAQIGRNHCDILNFKLGKDLNTILLRATNAREAAHRMKIAALACATESPSGVPEKGMKMIDMIRADAAIANSYLADGLAAEDFHILSQKVEYAIRVLYDILHIANTLQGFENVALNATKAIEHCESVVKARNWTEVKREVDKALFFINSIEKM